MRKRTIRMPVMDERRAIRERWTFGVCDNCGQNPEQVRMVREALVSGGPAGAIKAESEFWVCPKCGYCRKL